MQINMKVSYDFWWGMIKHSQSTQKNKFAMSLQNLRKNEKNEVGFLHADKNQRFLQMDTIILGVCG